MRVDRIWALPALTAVGTIAVTVNPMNYARLDSGTALVGGASLTIALASAVAFRRRRFTPGGPAWEAAAVAVTVAALVGGGCTSFAHEFARDWSVVARSPDGRYALAEYSGFSLDAADLYHLHLWAGTGALARDRGRLFSYDNGVSSEGTFTTFEFVDNRTIRAVVGDAEYVFYVTGGRAHRR